MRRKYLILGFFLLALTSYVSADGCPGVVSLNDNDEFTVGDTIQTLLTTTVSPVLGRRNIDLIIEDPEGGIFYSYSGVLDNDTYAMQFSRRSPTAF